MAKQLFNSSEKSNFILNMTEEKYSKLSSWVLVLTVLLTSLSSAIPLITGDKVYVMTSIGMTLGGVFCMVLALIGAMKKYISKAVLFPVGAVGFGLIWALVSMINSYDMNVAFNGFPGRNEGVLALLFYASFFLTAASLKGDKARNFLLYGILGNGLLNSAVSLVQIFKGEFSDYSKVSLNLAINAASGLSQSPIFLAMVLSITIAAAFMGLTIFEGKKSKIFCIINICLSAFVIMFTYSFVGICGIVLAVIAGIVMILAVKAPKKNLLAVFGAIIPAVVSVVIVNSGLIGDIDSYRLYDGRILWFADSYMRINSSGDFDSELVDIDDTYDVYYTLNRKAMNIISANGLTGTGPDQLVYPQIHNYGIENPETASVEDVAIFNKGSFDRVYNEYLNTAATRGIPSAIAFAAAVLGVLAIGFGNYKKRKNKVTLAVTLITAMGALLFLICCSSTAFTPIFWMLAGACLVNPKAE